MKPSKGFVKEYNKLVNKAQRERNKSKAIFEARQRGFYVSKEIKPSRNDSFTSKQLEQERYIKEFNRAQKIRKGFAKVSQESRNIAYGQSAPGRFQARQANFQRGFKGYQDPFDGLGMGVLKNSLGVGSIGNRAAQGRGRPSGASGKYRDDNGNPIGVYEYRMLLRQKIRERRLQLQAQFNQSQMSPEQRMALMSVAARQRAQMQDPENKTIPDTFGHVPLKSIHDEADDAAHLVD